MIPIDHRKGVILSSPPNLKGKRTLKSKGEYMGKNKKGSDGGSDGGVDKALKKLEKAVKKVQKRLDVGTVITITKDSYVLTLPPPPPVV